MLDCLNKKEPLHEDLVPYLQNTSIGLCLKHPLVFSLFHSEQMNAFCNEQYRQKKERTESLLKEKDFSGFIWFHERPYRLPTFVKISNLIEDEKQYWSLFASIWTDCENLWQYKKFVKKIISNKKAKMMMNEEELKIYESLPDVVKIFRGHQRLNEMGNSWSLSHFKSRWFAERFSSGNACVVEAFINKKDIASIITRRGEFEVICDPKKVIEKKNFIPSYKEKWIQDIFEKAKAEFALNQKSYHGFWHWEKVERNAIEISKATEGCDILVAQLFGILHDSKRKNEYEDSKHGLRAAQFSKELYRDGKLLITKEQLEKLEIACEFHDKGEVSKDPTIGACWDADRLELTRVGITPNPDFFSTKAGVDLMWKV